MKETTKGTWWAFFVFLVIVTIALIFCSCESKSGQLTESPNLKWERVIILESSHPVYFVLSYTEGFEYKVLRIDNQNTVLFMYNPNILGIGDTIMFKFDRPY